MYKSSLYLSTFFLIISLFACQSEGKDVSEIIKDPVKAVSATTEAAKIEESKAAEALEIKEKQEKIAELKALKEQKIAAQAEEAKQQKLAQEKKDRAAKRKRAKAREEKRLAEENERILQESIVKAEEVVEEETEPAGKLQFVERSHDFGKIQEGDTFEHEFKFFNASQIPVVISDVKASCGCTKTTFPQEPILPGESGVIGVTFDSKGKLGRQKPFMSVVTNGNPSIYSLYMDGEVDTERE